MVRVTTVLARVPVIKFRKGGLGSQSGAASSGGSAPASAPPSAASAAPSSQVQSAPMSTAAISDIDLPARYKRTPFTEEEIATINGGGVV